MMKFSLSNAKNGPHNLIMRNPDFKLEKERTQLGLFAMVEGHYRTDF